MPILNYTTSITTERTASEIHRFLVSAGAQAVLNEYDDDGILSSISFRIGSDIHFKLPINISGVYNILTSDKKVPAKFRTHAQAARVAWRIIKSWVQAQIAIIEAGQVSVDQVFLPYLQDKNGTTMYQVLKDKNFKLLE